MSAGSLLGFSFDGIPYRIAADSSCTKKPTIEKEGIRTSGATMVKRTLISGDYEGIKLTITPSEYDTLEAQVEALGYSACSLTWGDGSVFSSPAELNLGDYSSEDSSCEVMAIPQSGKWEVFAAS